jgi:hypothetical protein
MSCKVRSVQHYANQESSGSVKHKICTVAHILKNVQSFTQEGTDTRALSCVMKVAKTLCDQQNMWNEGHNLGSRVVNIKEFMKENFSL